MKEVENSVVIEASTSDGEYDDEMIDILLENGTSENRVSSSTQTQDNYGCDCVSDRSLSLA